ncbi:MAG TPA: hypothetical protein VGN54_04670 [Mycobacteriales bacterium]|jgi:hypothetical protein|nr:hypothetical protein [Mycobacteriales bacterium]
MHLNTTPFSLAEAAYRRDSVRADFARSAGRRRRHRQLPRLRISPAYRRLHAAG